MATKEGKLKIIESSSIFELDDDGPRFVHKSVVFTDGKQILHACVPTNVDDADINLECVGGSPISLEYIYPMFDPKQMTRVDEPLENWHIKRPSLLSYMIWGAEQKVDHIKDILLGEVAACETLARFPHPNIATYYGCEVENDRVVALYFARYNETLKQRVGGKQKSFNGEKLVKSLREAVEHMHKIGLCHNDIRPGNIMFDEDDRPVLIDFDSCRVSGQKLGVKVGNRDGFFPDDVEYSLPSNDFFALQKLQEYVDEHTK